MTTYTHVKHTGLAGYLLVHDDSLQLVLTNIEKQGETITYIEKRN